MRKGVVLKIKKDRAIIMADDCTYCEIKSFNGMYPGMEVCFREEDILKNRKLFSVNKYVTAACFILLVFCSYLFLSFYQENMAAYAYVGIDINPSIEIALNKKGRIINARGLDEEGKEILEEINVKNMDSMEGVKAIITKSIEMNYLEAENKNQITVYAVLNNKNSGDGKELVEKVERVIKEEVVAHSIDGEIKTLVSDKKVKKEADKKGISVAKYIMENVKENVVGKNNNKGKNEIMTMNTDKNKENKNKDRKDNKELEENKNTENKKIDKRDEVNESIKNKKDKLADEKNNKGNKDKEKEIDRHDNVKNKESGDDKRDKSERKADKDDEEGRKDKKNSEKYRNNEKDKDNEQVKNNKRDKERDDKKDNKKDGIGDNQKDNKNDDKKDNNIRDNNRNVRNDDKEQKMDKYNNKSDDGLINRLLQKIRN